MSHRHVCKPTKDAPKPKEYGWEKVIAAKNKYQGLLDLQSRTEEALAEIEKNKYFRKFAHSAMGFFKGHHMDLRTMITEYPSEIQMAFFCMSSDPKPSSHFWANFKEASKHQKKLAVTVCLLLQRIGVTEGIPQEVVDAAAQVQMPPDSEPSSADDVDPELTKPREDGRIIYVVMVDGQEKYFKLGTFELKDGYIYKRWEGRDEQGGVPLDFTWDKEKLKLLQFVYTRPEFGERPDEIIHIALKEKAKKLGLPGTPQGEFHHVSLLAVAMDLVSATAVGGSDGAAIEAAVSEALAPVDAAPEAAVPEAAAPVVVTDASVADFNQYNKTAKLMRWPQIHVSPGAHARYNVWANAIGRPLLSELPAPASSSFRVPAAARTSGAVRQKHKATGPAIKQKKPKAKGPPAIKQQKRKAKDDAEGSLRKYLTKKE